MINNALSFKRIIKKNLGVKQVSPWSLNNNNKKNTINSH